MADQPELDFSKRARLTDPLTSHTAAARAGEFAKEHHKLIYDSLLSVGPSTTHDLAAVLPLGQVAIARRMKELEDAGKVERTWMVRPSPSGRPCTVWKAIP